MSRYPRTCDQRPGARKGASAYCCCNRPRGHSGPHEYVCSLTWPRLKTKTKTKKRG